MPIFTQIIVTYLAVSSFCLLSQRHSSCSLLLINLLACLAKYKESTIHVILPIVNCYEWHIRINLVSTFYYFVLDDFCPWGTIIYVYNRRVIVNTQLKGDLKQFSCLLHKPTKYKFSPKDSYGVICFSIIISHEIWLQFATGGKLNVYCSFHFSWPLSWSFSAYHHSRTREIFI